MAKLKGIELKNITNFRGHEGEELIQGNVYYNGKKVGYYSQDSHGGMDIFELNYDLDNEVRTEIRKITDNYLGNVLFKKIDDLYNLQYHFEHNKGYQPKGYEYFFMDLLELLEHEKIYKKYSKKFNTNDISIIYKNLFDMVICSGEPKGQFANNTYFNYKSLNDFVIN